MLTISRLYGHEVNSVLRQFLANGLPPHDESHVCLEILTVHEILLLDGDTGEDSMGLTLYP